jgi:hypothetical protein
MICYHLENSMEKVHTFLYVVFTQKAYSSDVTMKQKQTSKIIESKTPLNLSFELVDATPPIIRAVNKDLKTSNIQSLLMAIYDDAVEAYKNACLDGDMQREQKCLKRLSFIETKILASLEIERND